MICKSAGTRTWSARYDAPTDPSVVRTLRKPIGIASRYAIKIGTLIISAENAQNLQELVSVSLKNVKKRTGLKRKQTPSFGLPSIGHMKHTLSTVTTTPSSITRPTWSCEDDLDFSKISWLQWFDCVCLYRTIQGWPSWKRLFALSLTKSFDEALVLEVAMGQHLEASATQISSKNTPTAARTVHD